MSRIDDFYDAWDEGDEEKMVKTLQKYLEENYPEVEDPERKITVLKANFESDLLPKVLSEAIGCEIDLCREIRWRGPRYGVVYTRGRERKSLPPSQRDRVMERDENQCVRCGSTDDLEIHHIVPISHGGTDQDNNLATLCKDCNKDAHSGDYSSRRNAYNGRDEFWDTFVEEYNG